jgi:CRISPR-associated protein Csb2
LQRLDHPIICTPRHYAAVPFRIAVPNNDWDSPARVWAKGGEPAKPHRPVDLKTMKTVWPTRLDCANEADNVLHYVYTLPNGQCSCLDVLTAAARSVTHLGWGIDMAVGDARIISGDEVDKLSGERWLPSPSGGTPLRVPVVGTLDDLNRKHAAFLRRLSDGGFRPVPPLTAFRVVRYRRATDPPSRPFAAFSILKPDDSGFRAFGSERQCTVVAGMVRHALKRVACLQRPFQWSDQDIARIVLGHDESGKAIRDDPAEPRFAYLPLPTIEHRRAGGDGNHVGAIRRVLVVGTPGMEREIDWARRALSGSDLIRESDRASIALLSMEPSSNWVVKQYTEPAHTWTTVTPVIVPGYDDRRPAKTEQLLRKALRQAGLSKELAERAEIDWRGVAYLPGVDLATRYRRPRNVSEAPVCHVRITWRDEENKPKPIAGPIAIGSGRFRGLGLFTRYV